MLNTVGHRDYPFEKGKIYLLHVNGRTRFVGSYPAKEKIRPCLGKKI